VELVRVGGAATLCPDPPGRLPDHLPVDVPAGRISGGATVGRRSCDTGPTRELEDTNMLQEHDLVAFVATTSLDRARAFYEGVLGLPLREQTPFAVVVDANGVTLRITLVPNAVIAPYTALGWSVPDIAEVVDSTEDNRSILRINGRPGVRLQVTKQSGTNTVQIAQGVRAEIARINQEVPGVKISLLDDSAKFIERSISAVQEHVMIGSVLLEIYIRNSQPCCYTVGWSVNITNPYVLSQILILLKYHLTNA
jgi:multidrug efflux pump subunit AcrB